MKDDYKVAVLGGTGKAGRYVIKELIKQGYSVKMLVRNPDKAPGKNSLIEVVTGSAKDYITMQYLLSGCNAVISTIGPSRGESNINSIAVGHVIKVMRQLKIKRYIEIAGLGIEAPGDKKGFRTRLIAKVIRTIVPDKVRDRQKVLHLLEGSDINWTIVRCPSIELTSSRRNPKLRLEDSPGIKVSAADLAGFIVSQLTDEQYFGKCPFVSS